MRKTITKKIVITHVKITDFNTKAIVVEYDVQGALTPKKAMTSYLRSVKEYKPVHCELSEKTEVREMSLDKFIELSSVVVAPTEEEETKKKFLGRK